MLKIKTKMLPSLFAFPLLVLVVADALQAQSPRGTILGTVRDTTGAVLPGVTVTVTNLGTNISQSFITDETGTYVVTALLPGQYHVAAELTGFKRAVIR